MKKKHFRGHWWLPEKPDNKLFGTLTFDNEIGGDLEVIGSLLSIGSQLSDDIVEIILGFTTTGDEITLYNSIRYHYNLSFPGIFTEKYKPQILFIGAHFSNNEDIAFKEVQTSCTFLGEWLQITGFKTQVNYQEKKVLIDYTAKEPDIYTFNDLTITFYQSADINLNIITKTPILTDKYFIKFIYTEEKSYSTFLRDIASMFNLISFAIREEITPTSLKGITETVSKIESGGRKYNPSIEILYKNIRRSIKPETINAGQMLFCYQEIKKNFKDTYTKWLNIINKLTPLYSLYFGASYNPKMYIENIFLNYVIALETYHRQVITNEETSEEKHKNRIHEILLKTPCKHSSWLKRKLKYSNEPNLESRLYKLLKINNLILKYNKSAKTKFVQNIVNTRNYLVHRDIELQKKALRGSELVHLNMKLKALAEICLLRELGFSDDQINTFCTKPFVNIPLEI